MDKDKYHGYRSVPVAVEIFKEVREQPEKLFGMIRFDI
jgi:hypothetical protein